MAYHHHSKSERRRILAEMAHGGDGGSRSRRRRGGRRKAGGTIIISAPGKKPIRFKRGALHEQLGVPQGQKIPASKKAAALAGRLGPLAKKRANFAFRGALSAGRRTARRKG